MSIPDVDTTRIEQALRDFDAQKRGRDEWANWESDGRFAYAILWQGRRYPVKEIVRMATDATDFITTQARSYLEQRGFQIVRLDSESRIGESVSPEVDRTSETYAREIIESFLPQTDVRQACLNLLADYIVQAHQFGANKWGVTLHSDHVRLNVGRIQVFVLRHNHIYLVMDADSLSEQDGAELKKYADIPKEEYITVPRTEDVSLPAQNLPSILPLVQKSYGRLVEKATKTARRTPYFKSHSPGVIAYLQKYLGKHIPEPQYHEVPSNADDGTLPVDMCTAIARSFALRGLHFTNWQIATYFTALQTKGFVILSGLSGTGKTKLAQHFAGLLSGPTESLSLSVSPTLHKEGRVTLSNEARSRFQSLPTLGSSYRLIAQFDNQREPCTLGHYRQENPVLQLTLGQEARRWLRENCEVEDELQIFMKGGTLYLGTTPEECFAFLSVRPDWRDSKSLLGYYNPLNEEYQSTRFLQFLLRAYENYQSSLHKLEWEAEHPNASTLIAEPNAFSTDTVRLGLRAVNAGGQVVAKGTFEFRVNENRQLALPGRMTDLQPFRNATKIYALEMDRALPHFFLLDEMNLARVEYYFADLLSVLESGRRPDGFTEEAIHFEYPPGAKGVVPPRELYLPPNLYFIGTVNVDETTHAFSPKVLDRAFTIEITEVDLEQYPAQTDVKLGEGEAAGLTERLMPIFTRRGRFGIVDKREIQVFVSAHPQYRVHLNTLKNLLQPYDLHFAYRVFDEIAAFCANAKANGLWADLGGLDTAFDSAVLMKILPKFHGPRGKLERPLRDVLTWALSPDDPRNARQPIEGRTKDADACLGLRRELDAHVSGDESTGFKYPHTARKAVRMLQALHSVGFASFA